MLADDIAWLGEQHARLAPLVRAGLGVLLATGDWAWWRQPDALELRFAQLERGTGLLRWGGDPAVLIAHEWLPPAYARQIAKAFGRLLERLKMPRLRIGKEVWQWNTGGGMHAIRSDLAHVLPLERIFCEWPSKGRRRHGPDVARLPPPTEGTGTRFAALLEESSANADWEDSTRARMAIGPPRALLSHVWDVELAIIVEDDARLALECTLDIRQATCAACVLRVGSDPEALRPWLTAFAQIWLAGTPIDDAMYRANRRGGMQGEILASTSRFILGSRNFFQPLVLSRSIPQAPAAPVRSRRIEYVALPSPPPLVRVLDAAVIQGDRILDRFPDAGLVQLRVGIFPKTPLHGARLAFPDDDVDWEGDSKRLRIHMTGLDTAPLTVEVDLPRTGASPVAEFHYEVLPSRPIDLRFLVSDGPRILQTARLQGAPGSPTRFFVETINTPVEVAKPPFDLALLVNDSLGGKPSATVLSPDGITLTVLDGHDIVNARRNFLDALQTSVKFPDMDATGTLFNLASKGRTLFNAVKASIPGWPDELKRIQLMTPENGFFPIEYLYTRPMPENATHGLCPERGACLSSGVARQPCAIRDDAVKLCPMNFLGITAIIERQTWNMNKPRSVFLSEPRPLAERQRVIDLGAAVFAASKRADEFADGDLVRGFVPVRLAELEEELGEAQPTWSHWRQAVKSNPALLVLIPHVDDEKLQIGQDAVLLRGAIEAHHVGAGNPIVVAIGCNSGGAPVPTSALPRLLMDKGAGAVIAALTEVLGRYTNAATLSFVEGLRNGASGAEAVTIGALVNRVRRELLAKDSVFGLVLVAFGDADYALGGAHLAEPPHV